MRDIVRDHRRDVQRKLEDICDLVQLIFNIVDGPPTPEPEPE